MEATILAHTINKGLPLEGFDFSIGYLGHFDISNAMLVNILGSTGTVIWFQFFVSFPNVVRVASSFISYGKKI